MSISRVCSFGGKEHKKRDIRTANLSDDVLFGLLMQRTEFCRIVLSIILNETIEEIEYNSIQENLSTLPGYRSVRLDVFAKSKDGTVYNVEMQKLNNDEMPKRARFYQSILDTSSLYKGNQVRYSELPKTYVIFITEFDPFGKGLYKYTFENRCAEIPDLLLGDNTVKMFLNTKGYVQGNEPDLLVNFLHYVSNSVTANTLGDPLLERLDTAFQLLKSDKRLGDDYMRTDWIEEEAKERGLAEGAISTSLTVIKNLIASGATEENVIMQAKTLLGITESKAMELYERALKEI